MSNGRMTFTWLLLAVAATVAATPDVAPTEATITATADSVDGCPAPCDCIWDDLHRYICGGQEVAASSDGNMKIDCNNTMFDCSLIPRLTVGGGQPLQSLEVSRCLLPPDATLSCATRAVEARGTYNLTIQEGHTAPTEANVRGLDVDIVVWKLEERKVNTIPIAALSALPHVRNVTLHSLWSPPLHGGMFASLPPTVQYLEVAMSALTHIPRDTFLGMHNLTILSLWGNNIESIDVDAFNGLTSLQELVLNDNPLSSFPPGVLRMTPLRYLYLERVYLLKHLSEGIFQGLRELREIKIRSNVTSGLTLGPRTFANLPSLASVTITYSKLTTLPADLFFNSSSLINITFEYNNITSLPSGIFSNQYQLKILNFRSNRLEAISGATFNYLAALETLDLSWNNITELPGHAFNGLPNLKHLNLSQNNISQVSGTTFSGARAVLDLDLSHNQLAWNDLDSEYSSSPFDSLNMMQTLNLSHNLISTVFFDWRNILPPESLTKLDLQYNAFSLLSYADVHFFGPRNNTTTLTVDFRHNNIAEVISYNVNYTNLEVIADSENNQTDPNVILMLESSSYNCSCNMYNLRVRAQRNNITYQLGESSCNYPPTFLNKKS